jgi:hypothetical protein
MIAALDIHEEEVEPRELSLAMCRRCGCEVDRLSVLPSGTAYEFTAVCHGEFQTLVTTDDELAGGKIVGAAFFGADEPALTIKPFGEGYEPCPAS